MTQDIPQLGIGAKVALAILAVAIAALFAYAAREAWEYDGYAHSHEAFGSEYDCVEE